MQVHLYALCWNEEALLPYFFRHYDNIVDKYFIYDNHSNDNSYSLLTQHPKVQVGSFDVNSSSFVLDATQFYNTVWKQSRNIADWVIIVNIDEHLYHPQMRKYLYGNLQKNITVIPSVGYQMLSNFFPKTKKALYKKIRYGLRVPFFDKYAIFNPNMIDEINYMPGRHKAEPIGTIHYPEQNIIKLLHYKFLGLNYVVERYSQLKSRLREQDIENSFGVQYTYHINKITDEFESCKLQSELVV